MSLEAIGLGLTALTVVVGATWKLSGDIKDVSTKVELILTNHLPHLAEDIKDLKREIRGE